MTASGLLVVDKPAGMTSHDVVGRIRRLAGTRRVGHAGTLDPMATGVLVVGVGQATRLLGLLALTDKDYTATVRLGVTTGSDDADGPVLETAPPDAVAAVADEAIATAVLGLTGDLLQVPPAVSAIKVDGRRAYDRAREGEQVELAARPVTVTRFDVLARRGDELDVTVTATTGTYIRSLARDLGAALGVGGHLTALRRTRSGRFGLADAVPLDDLDPTRDLMPLDVAAATCFACIALSEDEVVRVRHGQRRIVAPPEVDSPAPVALTGSDGGLVALADVRAGVAHPLAVFPGDAE